MKHLCRTLATVLILAFSIFNSSAAVPVAWTNTPAATQPYPLKPVPHGVPINFRVTLKGYTEPPVAPGADLHLWYQTNGMGSAWWRAPATLEGDVITATFGPAQDTGADRVSLFFGAPSNVFASAVLRLTHSPGFRPSALPLPTPTLDFAAVAWTNAPWTTSADVSNLVSRSYVEGLGISVGGNVSNLVDQALADKADRWRYNVVSNEIVSSSWWDGEVTLAPDGEYRWYYVRSQRPIGTGRLLEYIGNGVWNYTLTSSNTVYTNDTPCGTLSAQLTLVDAEGDTVTLTRTNEVWGVATNRYSVVYADDMTNALDGVTVDLSTNNAELVATIEATAPAPGNYSAVSNAAMSAAEDIESLQAESSLIYRLYSGSNVVCEVTNYNSRVNPPMMRLLQLTETNTYITVWTETNGLHRIARAATNYTDAAVAAAEAAAAETYAPRGWSATTSGMGAEAPSNTTWISTPTTVFAGGLEYEKRTVAGGQIWILSYHGDTVQVYTNQASNITLMSADGTEAFAVEKTDSYLVGVDADSISVSGTTVTMTVPVVAETHPYVRYTPSFSPVAWEKEEDGFTSDITASWSGSSGAWVCTVTTSATSGFFAFEFFQEGGVKVSSKGVLEVDDGILCTDGVHKIRPVYNNGSITWEVFQ